MCVCVCARTVYCACAQELCVGRGFETIGEAYPDFGREAADQRLAAVVGLDAALLLVVLDRLVTQ